MNALFVRSKVTSLYVKEGKGWTDNLHEAFSIPCHIHSIENQRKEWEKIYKPEQYELLEGEVKYALTCTILKNLKNLHV